MAKKKTSQAWMTEHVTDPFVRQAQKEGYRSRAAYKLLEIDERFQLFKPGHIVVDLGAAPGGWSQVVIKKILPAGRLIAIDCLPMESIEGVEFFQGDFTEEETLNTLLTALKGCKVDVVISDMAPNVSGIATVDQAKSVGLCELALDFAIQWLKPNGSFVAKTFQGEGFKALCEELRRHFHQVSTFKPKASRDRSSELFLYATRLIT